MSLILPPWYHQSGGIIDPSPAVSGPQEIRIPKPEVPPQLQKDLECNAKLEPKFYEAIGKALSAALRDPSVRPRELTHQILKEWTELCYKMILICRYDLNLALSRCFDILPDEFLSALKKGQRPEDCAEQDQAGSRWWRRSGAQDEEMKIKKQVPEEQSLSETSREELHQAQETGDALYEQVHGSKPDAR